MVTNLPSLSLVLKGYISQTMKLATVGLPSYRTFSLEEIEEATNNFDTASFMGESSHGQVSICLELTSIYKEPEFPLKLAFSDCFH